MVQRCSFITIQLTRHKIIVTSPTVPYKIINRDGATEIISNPSEFPDPHQQIARGCKLLEPMVDATMIFPSEYLGDVIELCEVSRE
jgi:translation factor GUF1, mitochondrial